MGRDTAAGLGRGIAAGRIDPVELAESLLGAIAAHPDAGRIYARLTPERARAEARAAWARARANTLRGPLDGVPLSWKDLFDTAGTATEAGSALLAGRVPTRDAEVLAAATRAGTVCLGKTHMTELAFSGLGLNPIIATPPNVHDPAWLPGGSSSGAAASVAFGLAPAAVGSDTGGSIRLPAAWNDLVGFKPAHGVLSLRGVVPLIPSFDTPGPLARNVEDAALVWQALGGARIDLSGVDLSGVVVGDLGGVVAEGVEEAPAKAHAAALARLAARRARVVPLALPDLSLAYDLGAVLYPAEAWATWRDVIGPGRDRMFPPVLLRMEAGSKILAADWIAARARLDGVRAAALSAMAPFDAVACPTSPILPPLAAAMQADPEAFRVRNLLALRNTRMANLLGLASISIPTGHAACGLMLSAAQGAEGRLLRLAAAASRALA